MSGAPQQQPQQQYAYAPAYGAAGYVPYNYNQQQQQGGGDYSADNSNNGGQQQQQQQQQQQPFQQQQGYAPQGYAMAPAAQGYAYPPQQQQGQFPQQAPYTQQPYQQQQYQQQQQQANQQQQGNNGYDQQQQMQQQMQQAPNTNTGYTHSPYNNDGNRRQSSSMSNSSRSHHSHDQGHGGHSMSSASSANDSGSEAGGAQRAPANVTLDNVHEHVGRIVTTATGSHGSSFLQAALRQYPIEAFEIIYKEIAPVMGKLLLDKHACYVVKMVLEMMDKDEAVGHLQALSSNEELLCTLCTKDLHSRRMIQFILDFSGPERCRYLFDLVMRRPMQIVRTQQGCITLQRILDHFSIQEKESYFKTVRGAFMEYALDPFGNYIIQYMLAEGNQVENSNTLALYCRGQLHNMICHKYASNVIEKCFGLVTPELQHDVIEEMFNAPQEALMRILTDASANYVVQAAIRAASYRDVQMINQRISPLLPSIPYGKKIQQRLNRRLNHNN